jgi:hypothetical protein
MLPLLRAIDAPDGSVEAFERIFSRRRVKATYSSPDKESAGGGGLLGVGVAVDVVIGNGDTVA